MASADGASGPPPPSVLDAFGVRGRPHRLAGGQGAAFVVDDVVLKPVDDEAEATFVQSLASRLAPTRYRLASPIAALDGTWVHRSWIANERIEGLRPLAPSWAAIISAGEAFAADASAAAPSLDRSPLADRTHRWAIADGAAWDERTVDREPGVRTVDDHLRALAGPPSVDAGGIVHADLAGNVHLDDDGTAVVLDLSLYERPTAWGSAVVVVDALLWHGAPAQLAAELADRAGGVRMVARAARFRLVADALAPGGIADADLGRYRLVVDVLGRA